MIRPRAHVLYHHFAKSSHLSRFALFIKMDLHLAYSFEMVHGLYLFPVTKLSMLITNYILTVLLCHTYRAIYVITLLWHTTKSFSSKVRSTLWVDYLLPDRKYVNLSLSFSLSLSLSLLMDPRAALLCRFIVCIPIFCRVLEYINYSKALSR